MKNLTEKVEPAFSDSFAWLAFKLIAVAFAGWAVVYMVDKVTGGQRLSNIQVAVVLICGVFYLSMWIRHGWKALVILVPVVLFQCAGCIPYMSFARHTTILFGCQRQLRQVGMGLQAYHLQHGSFPPAYNADASGKPLSSWRIQLLPYIEENYLLKRFHLHQPWDSPDNKAVSECRLFLFQCSVREGHFWRETENHCSYVAVMGPETAWPGKVGRSLDEFTDGPENTILLVEIAAVDHPWTAPDYLTLDNFAELMAKGSPYGPSSRHDPSYINVLFADGTTRHLPADLPIETWHALFTVRGGEKITLPDRETFGLEHF